VIWSLTGGFDMIATITVHDDVVNAVAFSPDGQRVVSCGNGGMLKVSSVDHGNEISSFDVGSGAIVSFRSSLFLFFLFCCALYLYVDPLFF
jgi:WD40 repeat protein